jgi:hypothetical protein
MSLGPLYFAAIAETANDLRNKHAHLHPEFIYGLTRTVLFGTIIYWDGGSFSSSLVFSTAKG